MWPASGVADFDRRVEAVLRVLHVGELEDLMLFLLAGDYSRLPLKLARHLRAHLRALGAGAEADEVNYEMPGKDNPAAKSNGGHGGNGHSGHDGVDDEVTDAGVAEDPQDPATRAGYCV
jgi:hypothetical protein